MCQKPTLAAVRWNDASKLYVCLSTRARGRLSITTQLGKAALIAHTLELYQFNLHSAVLLERLMNITNLVIVLNSLANARNWSSTCQPSPNVRTPNEQIQSD